MTKLSIYFAHKQLYHTIAFAQAGNFKQIRLDVIDENPEAKKPYEKIEFEPVKHEHTGYLKRLIGVNGVTTMIKKTVTKNAMSLLCFLDRLRKQSKKNCGIL